ncbi:DUF4240 domain-containing protein [Dactylosporangium sp. NPDC000244]|uniref:DUF4240 domain-containing protein n=1 Tax=Dactylosporangium sp. NPDC000244 TaxID=3154365 RepID=UPI00331D0E4E
MDDATADLWGAAYQIMDGRCSGEDFRAFRHWLVSTLDPATAARVLAEPDTLAEVPEIRRLAGRETRDWDEAEWPRSAPPAGAAPAGPSWDFDDPREVARRLPRLRRMFPRIGEVREARDHPLHVP